MFSEKKIKKNVNRLKFAIKKSNDVDFCIMYVCMMGEYLIRNKDGHLDSLIDEMKSID